MNDRCKDPAFALWVSCVLLMTCPGGWADVLIGSNGERFVGKVIEETKDTIIFRSEIGGRLTVPRASIRELQRTTSAEITQTNLPSRTIDSLSGITNGSWIPPGVGKDGFDWIKLKSDEWLKGHLDYLQNRKVQFNSDKLEDLTLKSKDVRQIYSGEPMFTKFDGREQLFGTVIVSNEMVQVFGPEQVNLPRYLLTGITPGGSREIEFWSAKATMGLNLQSGNSKQTTWNASAELARRTPGTQIILNYLGNFSEVNGEQNANNHRVNLSYDVRLNRDWFLRPVQAEYYRDQLANIDYRVTAGLGIGYYLFDTDDVEWKIAAGPGYQYTRFVDVAFGEKDTAATPAAIVQTKFKADITSRLTWIESFSATLASEQAGLYNHHFVSTLEFEIKKLLDLDLSFVWDYLQNPQKESDGTVPEHNDLRLTLGIGVKF
jgi:putative salt-induced outer membrane protein YdiY